MYYTHQFINVQRVVHTHSARTGCHLSASVRIIGQLSRHLMCYLWEEGYDVRCIWRLYSVGCGVSHYFRTVFPVCACVWSCVRCWGWHPRRTGSGGVDVWSPLPYVRRLQPDGWHDGIREPEQSLMACSTSMGGANGLAFRRIARMDRRWLTHGETRIFQVKRGK